MRHLRLSGTSVTFGPFRRLTLRHAGSLRMFGSAFFGHAILVFSDFPFNPSRKKRKKIISDFSHHFIEIRGLEILIEFYIKFPGILQKSAATLCKVAEQIIKFNSSSVHHFLHKPEVNTILAGGQLL